MGQSADGSSDGFEALRELTLTLGFAKRFTEYKRPTLLLRDQKRFVLLLNDSQRWVQIVVAGKAHPATNKARTWSPNRSDSRAAPSYFLAGHSVAAKRVDTRSFRKRLRFLYWCFSILRKMSASRVTASST